MVFIGGVVSQLTSGAWLKNLGFIPPYWFIFACHVASALCVIFLVPESKPKAEKKKMRFFSLDSFKAIWSVYRKPRNGGRKNLIMLLISDGIINLGVMGISGVVALFVLRTPLCWGPGTLGAFMAFRFFLQGLGGILGIGLLKRFMSDINVTRVGMLTQCASLVFFAFADRTWMVFLGENRLPYSASTKDARLRHSYTFDCPFANQQSFQVEFTGNLELGSWEIFLNSDLTEICELIRLALTFSCRVVIVAICPLFR